MEQNVVDYGSRTEWPGTPGCSGVAILTARACQTLIDDSNVFEGVAQSILDQGTCSINLGSTPSCDAACSCEP